MIIQNDFLPINLLEKISNSDLWFELASEGYKWQNNKTAPNNVWETIIDQIWPNKEVKIAGFEYWANICKPKNELGWHQDKDEKLYEEQDITISPVLSAVLYGYPHAVKGGYLEIEPSNKLNKTTERIAPEYNRLVMFNPTRWDRVMPIKEGYRFSFQVNIWEQKLTHV